MIPALDIAHCTCCPEPRLIAREGGADSEEWAHVDDLMFAETYHVHDSSTSRDCDGRHDSWHATPIGQLRWDRIFAADIAEGHDRTPTRHDLWTQMLRFDIPSNPWSHGTMTVTRLEDRPGMYEATIHEDTDEGSSTTHLKACDDPWCDDLATGQRDYFAEAAGY